VAKRQHGGIIIGSSSSIGESEALSSRYL